MLKYNELEKMLMFHVEHIDQMALVIIRKEVEIKLLTARLYRADQVIRQMKIERGL